MWTWQNVFSLLCCCESVFLFLEHCDDGLYLVCRWCLRMVTGTKCRTQVRQSYCLLLQFNPFSYEAPTLTPPLSLSLSSILFPLLFSPACLHPSAFHFPLLFTTLTRLEAMMGGGGEETLFAGLVSSAKISAAFAHIDGQMLLQTHILWIEQEPLNMMNVDFHNIAPEASLAKYFPLLLLCWNTWQNSTFIKMCVLHRGRRTLTPPYSESPSMNRVKYSLWLRNGLKEHGGWMFPWRWAECCCRSNEEGVNNGSVCALR